MEGSFESKPHVCFQVEKILGVSSDGNYQVQWAPAWVSRFHLVGCEHLIQEFLQRQREKEIEPERQKSSVNNRRDSQMQQQESEIEVKIEYDQSDEPSDINSSVEDNIQEFPQVRHDFGIEIGDEINDGSSDGLIMIEGSYMEGNHEVDDDNSDRNQELVSEKLNDETPMQQSSSWVHMVEDSYTMVRVGTNVTRSQSSLSDDLSSTQTSNNYNISQSHSFLPKDDHKAPEEIRPVGEKLYRCPHCAVKFKNKGNLSRHLRSHNNERHFSCDQCSYSSPRKYNLKLHIRTHTGEKPYRCNTCGLSFSQSSILNVHLRTHTKQNAHTCSVCGLKFRTTKDLNRHMHLYH